MAVFLFLGGRYVMKRNWKEKLLKGRRIENKKLILTIYIILRSLVILTMVRQFFNGDYLSVLTCGLTLVLFMLPSMIERRLHVDLPDTLEIVILLFIFAAEILGEIREFYVLVPHWDTALHTINGFLFAAIGFSIVNLLNENKRIAMSLSPFYMAVAAFCFSMTIGVLWEFFEWGMDSIFHLDMQKDTVRTAIHSVYLHPEGKNDPITLAGISDVLVVLEDGTKLPLDLGGYLDIGLVDTMKDLLVNLIGAVVFSIIGFFYIKTKGKGKVAKHFIPRMIGNEEA